jgi:hypothetical protein
MGDKDNPKMIKINKSYIFKMHLFYINQYKINIKSI